MPALRVQIPQVEPHYFGDFSDAWHSNAKDGMLEKALALSRHFTDTAKLLKSGSDDENGERNVHYLKRLREAGTAIETFLRDKKNNDHRIGFIRDQCCLFRVCGGWDGVGGVGEESIPVSSGRGPVSHCESLQILRRVLGCIEADFCNQRFVGKLSPRST